MTLRAFKVGQRIRVLKGCVFQTTDKRVRSLVVRKDMEQVVAKVFETLDLFRSEPKIEVVWFGPTGHWFITMDFDKLEVIAEAPEF